MEWNYDGITVKLEMGAFNDQDLGLVVKTENIPLGLDSGGTMGPCGTIGGFGISIREATKARNVEFWPSISMGDPDRRQIIYDSASSALEAAEDLSEEDVGFFTMGLEVARVPSWEVAEEIAKAIYRHSKNANSVRSVVVVVSSPTQMSSFQYAFNNVSILA